MIIFRPNPRDHSDIQKFDSGAEIKSPKTGFLTGLSTYCANFELHT